MNDVPNDEAPRPHRWTPAEKRLAVELGQRTRTLLDHFAPRLPTYDLELMRRVQVGGEWNEVMNDLVATLDQCEIRISRAEYAELRHALYLFPDLEPRDYIYDREAVLARLTVVDSEPDAPNE